MEEQKQKDQIIEDLTELADVDAEVLLRVADHLAAKRYRRERLGTWIKDESYEGKNKEIFRCSACGRWQSAKKREGKMFYMKYCPACGARMEQIEPQL